MKTIIAPIDFSNASANALSFAAELSRRAAARLIVINILQKGEAEEETKNKLKSVASDLKKSFGPGLNCEWSLEHGNLITSLKKIITTQQPDLIVIGTKGASGLKKTLIGSSSVKVLANTKVPVLVIPEVARFENFLAKGKNRIVLATDLDLLENEQALEILREIGILIRGSRISVLSVRPENTSLSDLKRMERDFLLSFFTPEIETERITVFGSNVINGINFYLNKNEDCGLIAMIARDSGHLIQKHYTREMASHTHYPLLVMHDAKP